MLGEDSDVAEESEVFRYAGSSERIGEVEEDDVKTARGDEGNFGESAEFSE